MIMRGDQDTLIGANVTQPWVDKLKGLKIPYEYKEIPGVEHGIINGCLPAFYEFFRQNTQKNSHAIHIFSTGKSRTVDLQYGNRLCGRLRPHVPDGAGG